MNDEDTAIPDFHDDEIDAPLADDAATATDDALPPGAAVDEDEVESLEKRREMEDPEVDDLDYIFQNSTDEY